MSRQRTSISIALLLLLLTALSCASHRPSATEILGLRIGMKRAAAETRLNEIADFVSAEAKNQQIWDLKDNSRFKSVAIGYRGDKVRFVTAFVDKAEAKDLIPFSRVGDLRSAKAEIMEPHYRYIWDVPPAAGQDAYTVSVYGDNPEFVTIYTLVARSEPGETDENDEDNG